MRKALAWLTATSIGLVAALVVLNWPALLTTSPINLVVAEVHLPLGLLMPALAAVPLALFLVAYLHQRIRTLMDTRDLLREVQRAHDLADKAEASRIDALRQSMNEQFRRINEHLDRLGAAPPARATMPRDLIGHTAATN